MSDIQYKLVKDLFSIPAGEMKVPVFGQCSDESRAFVPTQHADYVFRKENVRDVLAFLLRPHGDALWLTGPTGSGKTSLICETAARLNWPVCQVTCHGSMEFSELRGQFVVTSRHEGEQPSMQYRYGALSQAMKYGYILLINEIDLMDPAELAGLNDVLEGRPLVISENGNEVIEPHANFRLIATANSNGAGDGTGLYQGIQTQNIAAMDRYRVLNIDYPEQNVEISILENVAPALGKQVHKLMVKLANSIRTAFQGSSGMPGTISVTMSTRTLVRWALLSQDFFGASNALKYALDQALLNRCNAVEREAITDLCKVCFGDMWTK